MKFAFALVAFLCAVPALAKDKPVVVVVPFQGRDAASAVEYFTVKLVEGKKVRVVERAKLDKVLKEHELNLSGFVDPTTIKKQLGKGLAADYAIIFLYFIFVNILNRVINFILCLV